MHLLETYLQDLCATRSSGGAVKETSYYPALANLLNEVGKALKPKVRCIIHLQDTGGGIPDGGLFTEEQIRNKASDLHAGATPSRGAIEAKPVNADAWKIAGSKQVNDYWTRYRQVLVTNYRDFLLVGSDAEGNRAVLETYRLAPNEQEFWRKAAHPRVAADQQGESFEEFLKRVMLYQASLATPRDLAWFLASYAREAKFRIEAGELPALAGIRAALEEALGLRFEGVRGDHFFRSTLIQTLFYGIFSAWVLWSKSHPPTNRKSRFEWRTSATYLRVPILRKLFHEVAEPGQLETLNLPEVLDWAGAALNRVDRASFFANFEEGHAVQYFYEPFLEAFDPELRKDLGVWYTPTEVVKYMVARVDAELRNTLGVEDGLADPNVFILDPCCGTGAYLVEVLRKIAETLKEKGGDALAGHDLKEAALDRVFGFEILPAPFVVAHLQLGLLLQSLGAPLSENKQERARVFLTNALTGWEPVKHPKQLVFHEMEEEREAAEKVKRETPILVDPRQSALQQLRRHRQHGRGAGVDRGVPHHEGSAGAAGAGTQRPVRPLLPHGRPAHRGKDRQGHRLVHLELLVARRPVVHRHAGAVPGGVRSHLDRLPERRQVQDRKAYAGWETRPERLFDRVQQGGNSGRHGDSPSGQDHIIEWCEDGPVPASLGKGKAGPFAGRCGRREHAQIRDRAAANAVGAAFRTDAG